RFRLARSILVKLASARLKNGKDDSGFKLQAQYVHNFGMPAHALPVNMDRRLRLTKIDMQGTLLHSLDLAPFDERSNTARVKRQSLSGNPQSSRLLLQLEKCSPVFHGANFNRQGVRASVRKPRNMWDKSVAVHRTSVCIIRVGFP